MFKKGVIFIVCPKCSSVMAKYYPEYGYANTWRCPVCKTIVENNISNNDRERTINWLKSMGILYEEEANDIIITSKYCHLDPDDNKLIALRFDQNCKFLGIDYKKC